MIQRRIFPWFFHSLRSAERLVPTSLLARIIWPAVAVFAVGRSLGDAGRMWRHNFSAAFGRPPGFMLIWRSFISETYGRLATLWPDRLMTPAWRSRFMVTGLEDLQACHAAGRPVVLAVIHAQPLNLLRLFLRAHGLPVATLTSAPGMTGKRELINAAVDRSSPLAGVPHKFLLSQLRSAYAFLRKGNCLLVACDKKSDDAVALPTDLGGARIHVGPFRLAGLVNASVVPAVCWQVAPWRFHLALGEPMMAPASDSDLTAFMSLAEHCLATWQPLIQRHPEQVHFVRGAWTEAPQPTLAGRHG